MRIFDRKGSYTVHGKDTQYIARTFHKGTAIIKQMGKGQNQLETITLNRSLFEQLLRDALVGKANRVVELYEGHGASWQVTKQASPGQLAAFEDELFRSNDMVDAPIIMSAISNIADGVRTIGVAYADVAGHRIGVSQFDDSDQLCDLERVIIQLGVRECVLPQDSATSQIENAKLEQVLSDCNILVSRRPRAHFAAKDVEASVEVLLKGKSMVQHEHIVERTVACSALAALVKFTELGAKADNHGRFTLELYNPENFMRLDRAAQGALHVFPARSSGRGATSIYSLLNHNRTAMGKRMLRSWLKQPLTDVAAIQERHAVVQAFVEDDEMRESVRDSHLRGMTDIQRLSRKLASHKITLQELCQLYMASMQLPALVDALTEHQGDAAELLKKRFVEELSEAHSAEALVKFEQLVEEAVDLDAVPEEYLIDANYDAALKAIKQERDAAARQIENEAKRIADKLGLELDKSVKLEWHKSNNVSVRCMRITKTEEKKVRNKFKSLGFVELETRKDGTKFTSKALKEHAAALNAHTADYSDTQKSILNEVRDVAATFLNIWERVGDLIAELDVLASFAHAATSAPTPYCRPEMLGGEAGELVLKQCRHPCLELQEGMDVIPNDCVMSRGESWFHIITGPNMGGKSTFIRQVGVCVLMAQVGSFVPCNEARIAVRDCIFARVGAGDCQQKGISTFMAEMLETAAILKGAKDRSLLIIDELGRGTSTYDGFGLAWALSEHIMKVIGAPTLFATHFHELTSITGPVGVKNSHMQTNLDLQSNKLTMLYNVVDGVCDQSFGIHVAEFAGFPQRVIDNAKDRLAKLEAGGLQSNHLQIGDKRSRDDLEQDGQQDAVNAIKEFLKSFSELPIDQMEQSAVEEQLESLKAKLQDQAASNSALNEILIAGTTA